MEAIHALFRENSLTHIEAESKYENKRLTRQRLTPTMGEALEIVEGALSAPSKAHNGLEIYPGDRQPRLLDTLSTKGRQNIPRQWIRSHGNSQVDSADEERAHLRPAIVTLSPRRGRGVGEIKANYLL